MKVEAIEVSGLRGFNTARTLALSPTLTVIYALNGRGKTSLCEAWNWLHTGQMMALIQPASETKKGHLNVHAAQPGYVRLLGTNRSVLAERQWDGSLAAPLMPNVHVSPVLLQYALQRVLHQQPGERRAFFDEIAGLGVESSVADALAKAAARLKPHEEPQFQLLAKVARDVGVVLPKVKPLTVADLQADEDAVLGKLAQALGVEATAQAVRLVASSPEPLGQRVGLAARSPFPKGHEATLKAAAEALQHLRADLEGQDELAEWRRKGLDLATPPSCPMCGEPTLGEGLREQVKVECDQQEARTLHHREAKSVLDEALAPLARIPGLDLDGLESELAKLPALLRAAGLEFTESTLSDFSASLAKLETSKARLGPLDAAGLKEEVESLCELCARWTDVDALVARLLADVAAQEAHVAKLVAARTFLHYLDDDSAVLRGFLARREEALAGAKAAEGHLKALVAAELGKLEKEILAWYTCLRETDNTPVTAIRVAAGATGAIRVLADRAGEVMDAAAVFSHSNSNAFGMAAHIARVKGAGHHTIVFDDPFQSLDDPNKNIAIDKMVGQLLAEGLQVVICTHEQNAATMLLDTHAAHGPLGWAIPPTTSAGTDFVPFHGTLDKLLSSILGALETEAQGGQLGALSSLRALIEALAMRYMEDASIAPPPADRQNLGAYLVQMAKSPNAPVQAMMKVLRDWNNELPVHGASLTKLPDYPRIRQILKDVENYSRQDGHLKFAGSQHPRLLKTADIEASFRRIVP